MFSCTARAFLNTLDLPSPLVWAYGDKGWNSPAHRLLVDLHGHTHRNAIENPAIAGCYHLVEKWREREKM